MQRRQVPDRLTLRQLQQVGVDSLLTRTDILHLRRAGVTPPVIEAAIRASDHFAEEHGHGPDAVFLDAAYAEPFGFHGSVGFGFGAEF